MSIYWSVPTTGFLMIQLAKSITATRFEGKQHEWPANNSTWSQNGSGIICLRRRGCRMEGDGTSRFGVGGEFGRVGGRGKYAWVEAFRSFAGPPIQEQVEHEVRLVSDLIQNHRVLVSFMYTHCNGICPMTTPCSVASGNRWRNSLATTCG